MISFYCKLSNKMNRIFLIIALLFAVFHQYCTTESDKKTNLKNFDYPEYADESELVRNLKLNDSQRSNEKMAKTFSAGVGCPRKYVKINGRCRKLLNV